MQKQAKQLLAALIALAPVSATLPAMADDIILAAPAATTTSSTVTTVESTRPASSSSTLLVEDTKGVQFKFKERLANIQEQVDRGVNNKWLSVGQAAAFKAERDRLCDVTSAVESEGWPKDKVDQLEKDVTALSAKVSSATTNGGPKPMAPTTEESGAPLAK